MSENNSRPKNTPIDDHTSLAPGMTTDIWGPLMWSFLNDAVIIIDKNWGRFNSSEKESWVDLLYLMCDILPCRYCRESYSGFVSEIPPTFPFSIWLHHTHDRVNEKLDKPMFRGYDIFIRKAHVYTSFASAQVVWDICFILALNYDHTKKKKVYQTWFNWLRDHYMFFVDDRQYHKKQMQQLVKNKPLLQNKETLFRWLVNQKEGDIKQVDVYLNRFSWAISHKNEEELLLICGPLHKLILDKWYQTSFGLFVFLVVFLVFWFFLVFDFFVFNFFVFVFVVVFIPVETHKKFLK